MDQVGSEHVAVADACGDGAGDTGDRGGAYYRSVGVGFLVWRLDWGFGGW